MRWLAAAALATACASSPPATPSAAEGGSARRDVPAPTCEQVTARLEAETRTSRARRVAELERVAAEYLSTPDAACSGAIERLILALVDRWRRPGPLYVRLVTLYLERFPDRPRAGPIRAELREARDHIARIKQGGTTAAVQLETTARERLAEAVGDGDDRARFEAAYHAYRALNERLVLEPDPAPDAPPKTAVPIPEHSTNKILALEIYMSFRSGMNRHEVERANDAARLLASYGHHAESAAWSRRAFEAAAGSPSDEALELLVSSLERLGRDAELLALARRAHRGGSSFDASYSLQRRLLNVTIRHDRRRAEALEHKKEYAACARLYRELYRRAPIASGAAELLHRAAVCYELARDRGRAVAVYQKVIARFGNTRWAAASRRRLDRLDRR